MKPSVREALHIVFDALADRVADMLERPDVPTSVAPSRPARRTARPRVIAASDVDRAFATNELREMGVLPERRRR